MQNANEVLNKNIAFSSYERPTPIQAQAIPPVIEGRDVLGLAQAGTGKTAAFVLPILQQLITNRVNTKSRPPRALIIAPTRELAEQINKTITTLGRKTAIYNTTIYGGVSMRPQVDALRHGVFYFYFRPGLLLTKMRLKM